MKYINTETSLYPSQSVSNIRASYKEFKIETKENRGKNETRFTQSKDMHDKGSSHLL